MIIIHKSQYTSHETMEAIDLPTYTSVAITCVIADPFIPS